MIKVIGNSNVLNIMQWLNLKKFKYNIDALKTDALHGVYYLQIRSKEEELITKLAWGLI